MYRINYQTPQVRFRLKIFITQKSDCFIKKRKWRIRVSIPVLPACKAGALPFELIPRYRAGMIKNKLKLNFPLVSLARSDNITFLAPIVQRVNNYPPDKSLSCGQRSRFCITLMHWMAILSVNSVIYSLNNWTLGQVVRKPIHDNPGLKVNGGFNFSFIIFFIAYVLWSLR